MNSLESILFDRNKVSGGHRHETPLPMTRREVVIGAAALLAESTLPARAFQNDPDKAKKCYALYESHGFYTDLSFDWDKDNNTLAVYETVESSAVQEQLFSDCVEELQAKGGDKSKSEEDRAAARKALQDLWENLKQGAVWQVYLSPIDPEPQVELNRIESPSLGYRLAILCSGRLKHEASVAPVPGQLRRIVLNFHREDRNKWKVAVETDFWSKRTDLVYFGAAPFKAFVDAALPAEITDGARISGPNAEYALGQLFGRQFRSTGKFRVAVNDKLEWVFPKPAATDGKLLLYGSGTVCDVLCGAAWHKIEPRDPDDGSDPEPELRIVAEGLAHAASGSVVLGDIDEFHVHFSAHAVASATDECKTPKENEPETGSQFPFKVSNSSRMTGGEAELSASRWTFDIQSGRDGLTSPVAGHGKLVRREIPTGSANKIAFQHTARLTGIGPTPPALANIVAAQAGVAANGAAGPGDVIFPMVTPAGTLKVRGWTMPPRSGETAPPPPADGAEPGKNEAAEDEKPPEFLVQSSERYEGGLTGAPVEILEQAHLKLDLMEAPFALSDASHSRLRFNAASLSVIYLREPVKDLPTSYVWLDAARAPDMQLARIDLTRAKLAAQNDVELLSLTFRFSDLALLLPLVPAEDSKAGSGPGFRKSQPKIVPLPEECRIVASSEAGEFLDNRPRLVVEFPPQHVLEETLFRPQPAPPPEVIPADLGVSDATFEYKIPSSGEEKSFSLDPRILILELAPYERSVCAAIRRAWYEAVTGLLNGKEDVRWENFVTFRKEFDKAAAKLPEDQKQYIGPAGLAPDSFAVARATVEAIRQNGFETQIDELVGRLAKSAADAIAAKAELERPENLLKLEAVLETEHPLYALFRSVYRDAFYRYASESEPPPDPFPPWQDNGDGLKGEFIFPRAKPADFPRAKPADAKPYFHAGYFTRVLKGEDPISDLLRARLANPSRLVFAVNCESGAHEAEDLSQEARGPIAYTLAGLTNWSRHELVVVRRAQQLFEADPHGLLGPINKRIASVNESDILLFQGIRPNKFTTVQQRLSDVSAALRRPPGAYETAVEIPARLILSPNQNAAWTTPHRYDDLPLWNGTHDGWKDRLFIRAPEDMPAAQRPRGGIQALWTAAIDTEVAEPGLRAVYSPDFRPGFFWSKFPAAWGKPRDIESVKGPDRLVGLLQVLGNRPPPRGPLAPWHLGREQSEDKPPEPDEAFNVLPPVSENWPIADGSLCTTIEGTPKSYPGKERTFSIPMLIDFLCRRKKERLSYADAAIFRAALDAYDRHELVLLTSAYGLPVQGKRDEADALMRDSDQFEPPKGYELADLYGDTAIYRPRTLNLRELTLTSMGGTFRHDTSFQPPAAAMHMGGFRVYDSLAIERWQQWTVLGRDIVVEVVYKGYLFPLGVRASLVKLTERTFLKNDRNFIKAYLRQRKFIRCGRPEKPFPAMRQPNGGRRFPAELVRMLTVTTPDIVDPENEIGSPSEVGPAKVWPSGRIKSNRVPNAGLIFWPRTALNADSDVTFDITVDGRKTRLPLIFADNTAVQDNVLIADLVTYYNCLLNPDFGEDGACRKPGDTTATDKKPECRKSNDLAGIEPRLHKRTLVFGGQTLRYGEETKVGDCTIETDSWTLIAEGRREADDLLGGINVNFRMDAQMQGADQPPFFPALATARVRLKQVERLSGATAPPTLVQFDGGYINRGFDNAPDRDRNPLEVYLNFATPVGLDMGNNGDRSGGMYSPGNDFVAMSRKNGPIGGKDGNNASLCLKLIGGLEDWSGQYLSFPAKAQAAARGANGVPAASGANGPPAAATDIANKITVLKNYFSPKAKLFGIIRIDKLIAFLGIHEANPNELPVVKEIIEFGPAAMHEAEAAGNDIKAFLKTDVLVPLLKIIDEINARWREIQAEWNEQRKQADQKGLLDLAQLFPEIGTGLSGLSDAIRKALAEEDSIAFALQLSAVYEAGQQLLAGLRRVAANPVGRITEGAQKLFDQYRDMVKNGLADIVTFLNGIGNAIAGLRDDILEFVAEQIVEAAIGTGQDLFNQLPLYAQGVGPIIRLIQLHQDALEDVAVVDANVRLEFTASLEDFSTIISDSFTREALKAFVKAALAKLAGGTADPFAVFDQTKFETALERIATAADAVIADVISKGGSEALALMLASGAVPSGNIERVLAVMAAAGEVVTRAEAVSAAVSDIKEAATAIDGGSPAGLAALAKCLAIMQPHLPEMLAVHVQRFGALTERVAAVWTAVNRKDFEVAIRELLALLSPAIGAYTVAEVEQLAAPLTDAYKDYLVLQAETLKPLVEAGGSNAAIAKTLDDFNREFRDFAQKLADNEQKVIDLEGLSLPSGDPLKQRVDKLIDSYQALRDEIEPAIKSWVPVQALLRQEANLAAAIASDLSAAAGNPPTIWELLSGGGGGVSLARLRELMHLRLAILRELAAAATTTAIPLWKFVKANEQLFIAIIPLAIAVDQNPNIEPKIMDAVNAVKPWLDGAENSFGKATQSLIVAVLDAGLAACGLVKDKAARLIAEALQKLQTALESLPAGLGEEVRKFGPLTVNTAGLENFAGELKAYRDGVAQFTKFDEPPPDPNPLQRLTAFKSVLERHDLLVKAAQDLAGFTQQDGLQLKLRKLADVLPAQAEHRFQMMVERLQAQATEIAKIVTSDFFTAAAKAIADKGQIAGGVTWPGLLALHESILRGRKAAVAALEKFPESVKATIRDKLVVPRNDQKPGEATVDDDLLTWEIGVLTKAKEESLAGPGIAQLRLYVRSWRAGMAAPLRIAANMEELVGLVLRGELASLIDFSAVRDEIEQRIKQLVPLRATLGYTFGGPFTDVDKVKDVTAGIFAPETDCRLDIRTSVKVEFLKPAEPQVNVVGDLGAFSIKLVGDLLDAVTINFYGARFTIENGKSPDVDLFYKDFKIGKSLEFVQKLQAFLTPEKGSGFFLKFTTRPLGIEAGYGLALPMIPLGPIIFSNISLNASIVIPFDGGETRFRASLSRIDAPFTISVAPYGGSGFFAIEANADGVIGFEASFEFGGAAAFQFGPLKGIGRLMLGVYIRQTRVALPPVDGEAQSKNLVDIMGTFFVGGTASIWIFNFGASLYVRLGMSGGNMVGDATFTFSFSCGFVDFDYSVTVRRQENKMGGGALFDMGRRRYAQLLNVMGDSIGDDGGEVPAHFRNIKYENKTVCQGVDWSGYKRYFDYSLEKEAGEEFL